MDYKVKPVYSKGGDKIVATRIKKHKLEEDFDGYYDRMQKLLDANVLKIEDYDESQVIVYDKERYTRKISND